MWSACVVAGASSVLHPLPDADRTGCAAGPPVAVSTSVWLRLGSRFEVKYRTVPCVTTSLCADKVATSTSSSVTVYDPMDGPVKPVTIIDAPGWGEQCARAMWAELTVEGDAGGCSVRGC